MSEPRQLLESAKQVLLSRWFDKSRGKGMGFAYLGIAGGVAEAVSPWLTGRLRDATGNYSTSYYLLVGVALLGAIAVLGLPGRRTVA